MAKRAPKKEAAKKTVETLTHKEAKRKNIPTAEYQSVLQKEEQQPKQLKYPRNTDLDPQLVWRGKDEQDWSDLVVQAPPLFIQEKIQPKVLIDDLIRQTRADRQQHSGQQIDLFADFNGIPEGVDRTEFYQHDQNWSNRMILGDSLQVMASLAEREGLRGKVQCIYIDPPYGIRFNSNFQWSTTSRDVKDGNAAHITREPEQVKAFRDTWRDGIHSYLTYLRDRLTVARDLLSDSGSIFVQIGDENVHRVRAVMDEVFGENNSVSQVTFKVTTNLVAGTLGRDSDYILWYAKSRASIKYRQLFRLRTLDDDVGGRYSKVQRNDGTRTAISDTGKTLKELCEEGHDIYRHDNITSQGATPSGTLSFDFRGHVFHSGGARHWTTAVEGLRRLGKADRLAYPTPNSLVYVRFFHDFPVSEQTSVWRDTQTGAFTDENYM
jgi:adenine-specific DNA-methyltransferase